MKTTPPLLEDHMKTTPPLLEDQSGGNHRILSRREMLKLSFLSTLGIVINADPIIAAIIDITLPDSTNKLTEELNTIRAEQEKTALLQTIYEAMTITLEYADDQGGEKDLMVTGLGTVDGFGALIVEAHNRLESFIDLSQSIGTDAFNKKWKESSNNLFFIWKKITNVEEYSRSGAFDNIIGGTEKKIQAIKKIQKLVQEYDPSAYTAIDNQIEIIQVLFDTFEKGPLVPVLTNALRGLIPMCPDLHQDYYESLAWQYIYEFVRVDQGIGDTKTQQNIINSVDIFQNTSCITHDTLRSLFGRIGIPTIIAEHGKDEKGYITWENIREKLDVNIQKKLIVYVKEAYNIYTEQVETIEKEKEEFITNILRRDFCAVAGRDQERDYDQVILKEKIKSSIGTFDDEGTTYQNIYVKYKKGISEEESRKDEFLAYLDLKRSLLNTEESENDVISMYMGIYPEMTNMILVQAIQGMVDIGPTFTEALAITKKRYAKECLHTGLQNGMIAGLQENGNKTFKINKYDQLCTTCVGIDMQADLVGIGTWDIDEGSKSMLKNILEPTFVDVATMVIGAGIALKAAKVFYKIAKNANRIRKVVKTGTMLSKVPFGSAPSTAVVFQVLRGLSYNATGFVVESSVFHASSQIFATAMGVQDIDMLISNLSSSRQYLDTMAFMGIFKVFMGIVGVSTKVIIANTDLINLSPETISTIFSGLSIPIEVGGMYVTSEIIAQRFYDQDGFKEPTIEEAAHLFAIVLGFRGSKYLRPWKAITPYRDNMFGGSGNISIIVEYADGTSIQLGKKKPGGPLEPKINTPISELSRHNGLTQADIYLMRPEVLDADNYKYRLQKASIATGILLTHLYTQTPGDPLIKPTILGKKIILTHLYGEAPYDTTAIWTKVRLLTGEDIPAKVLLKNGNEIPYTDEIDIYDIVRVITTEKDPIFDKKKDNPINITARRKLIEQNIVGFSSTEQLYQKQKEMFQAFIDDFTNIDINNELDNNFMLAVSSTSHVFRNVINGNFPKGYNTEKVLYDLLFKNRQKPDVIHKHIKDIIIKSEITLIEKVELRGYFAFYRQYKIAQTKNFIIGNIGRDDKMVKDHLTDNCKTIKGQTEDVADVFVHLLTAVGIDSNIGKNLLYAFFAYRIKTTESVIIKLMLTNYKDTDRRLWMNIIKNGTLEDTFGGSLDFKSSQEAKIGLLEFLKMVQDIPGVEILKISDKGLADEWTIGDNKKGGVITINNQTLLYNNGEIKGLDPGKTNLGTANITLGIQANGDTVTFELQFKTDTKGQVNRIIEDLTRQNYAQIEGESLVVINYKEFRSYFITTSVDLNHNLYKNSQWTDVARQGTEQNRQQNKNIDKVDKITTYLATKVREDVLRLDYTAGDFAQNKNLQLIKDEKTQHLHILSIKYTLLDSRYREKVSKKDLTDSQKNKAVKILQDIEKAIM